MKRFFLFPVAYLLMVYLSLSAWATHYLFSPVAATGNHNVAANWFSVPGDVNAVPGPGDTIAINTARKCIIVSDWIVGHAPDTDDATPAVFITGAWNDERIEIAEDVNWTVRGDILTDAEIRIKAGANLIIDTGEHGEGAEYKIKMGQANNNYFALLKIEGTEGHLGEVTLDSGVDGGGYRFTSGGGNSGRFECEWFAIRNAGKEGDDQACLNVNTQNGFYFRHGIFDTCATVACFSGADIDTYVTDFSDNVFRDSLECEQPGSGISVPICFMEAWAATISGGGSRTVERNRFDRDQATTQATGVEWNHNTGGVLRPANVNHRFAEVSYNFWWKQEGTVSDGPSINAALAVDNYCYTANNEGNGRAVGFQAWGGNNVVDGMIWDMPLSTVGDIFNYADEGRTLTIKNSYVLPNTVNHNGPATMSGGADGDIEIYHCTIATGPSIENSLKYAETTDGEADMYTAVKSNLFWTHSLGTPGYKASRGTGDGGAGVQDGFSPAGWLNNWGSNLAAGNIGNGFFDGNIGNGPPSMFSTVPSGDGAGAAGLVDEDANMEKWADSLSPGETAEDAYLHMIAGDPGYTYEALRASVVEGMTPTNITMSGTAHDNVAPSNGWPGAIEGEASSSAKPHIIYYQSTSRADVLRRHLIEVSTPITR